MLGLIYLHELRRWLGYSRSMNDARAGPMRWLRSTRSMSDARAGLMRWLRSMRSMKDAWAGLRRWLGSTRSMNDSWAGFVSILSCLSRCVTNEQDLGDDSGLHGRWMMLGQGAWDGSGLHGQWVMHGQGFNVELGFQRRSLVWVKISYLLAVLNNYFFNTSRLLYKTLGMNTGEIASRIRSK